MLYGVLCLQRDHPGQAVVPLEQVREAAQELHAEMALAEALPRIRSQFATLEAEVGGFMLNENAGGGSGQASVSGGRAAGVSSSVFVKNQLR